METKITFVSKETAAKYAKLKGLKNFDPNNSTWFIAYVVKGTENIVLLLKEKFDLDSEDSKKESEDRLKKWMVEAKERREKKREAKEKKINKFNSNF
jgi:hypothetical protein